MAVGDTGSLEKHVRAFLGGRNGAFVMLATALFVGFGYSFGYLANNDSPQGASCKLNAAPSHEINIVAHEDDDLLFMNPDIQHSIEAGNYIRTVYVTAGQYFHLSDPYWLYREEGIKAAYAQMAGLPNKWTAEDLHLPNPRASAEPFVVRAFALDGSCGKIRIVFLRLPDAGARIQALWTNEPPTPNLGTMPSVICPHLDETVDPHGECQASRAHTTNYTREDLVNVLVALMRDSQTERVRLTDISALHAYDEHSDHYYTARFGLEALRRYSGITELTTYRTYSIVEEPDNLSIADATAKADVFDTYGKHDMSMCESCMTRNPGTGQCEACASCEIPPACEWPVICSPTWNYGRARKWVKRQFAMPVERGQITDNGGHCLDRRGTEVIAAPCANTLSQQWLFVVAGPHVEREYGMMDGGQIRTPDGDMCLGSTTLSKIGTSMGLEPCPTFAQPAGIAERWRLDGGEIHAGGTSLCLGLGDDGEHLSLRECTSVRERWAVVSALTDGSLRRRETLTPQDISVGRTCF